MKGTPYGEWGCGSRNFKKYFPFVNKDYIGTLLYTHPVSRKRTDNVIGMNIRLEQVGSKCGWGESIFTRGIWMLLLLRANKRVKIVRLKIRSVFYSVFTRSIRSFMKENGLKFWWLCLHHSFCVFYSRLKAFNWGCCGVYRLHYMKKLDLQLLLRAGCYIVALKWI